MYALLCHGFASTTGGGSTQALDGQIAIIIVQPGNDSERHCLSRPAALSCPNGYGGLWGDATRNHVGLHRLPEQFVRGAAM
jgi:hypothetical protein